ncbi:ion channel [Gillisia sp. Hel_I_86]|nr:ion channel [Gillisia sp. Hel_I_86]
MAATAWEKIYYAGFIISTLGMGDYIPSRNIWRMVTDMYAFTGLILLTMSVTYFIPVLTAVIEQRKLGLRLKMLGTSPQDIIMKSWNGQDFSRILDEVQDIAGSLIKHSQNHRAYPVIHYFHNCKKNNTIILQMARLFETLYLFKNVVRKDLQPSHYDLYPLEVAFQNYIEVITEVGNMSIENKAPEWPEFNYLVSHNISMEQPPTDHFTIEDAFQYKRRVFLSLVKQDGWEWEDIHT